jgi:VWFA-related protein
MRRPAILIALLLLSFNLTAQNKGPLPPLTAHVEVQVINVDAVVTDTDGKPVMNLTRDDFEVFEDGKPQKITNFSVFDGAVMRDAAAAAAAAKTAVPEELRRKVLLLVDNNYIEKSERDLALNRIEQYLTKSYDGNFDYAVASVGHGVRMLQPFTTDIAALHRAFDAARKEPVLAGRAEMERTVLSDRTRRSEAAIADNYDYGAAVRFSGREQTFRNLLAISETAKAVIETARAHSADTGKKFMILLTGGMETNTSFKAYDTKDDQQMQQLRTDLAKIQDEMVREANGASFTVHVVNARAPQMIAPQHDVENASSGIRMTSPNLYQTEGMTDPIDTRDVDSIPLTLALGTGGMYLRSNDLNASMQAIDRQTTNFYSLGYQPSHQGDRQYHRIRVNVKRKGVRVANRLGYYDLTADDKLEDMLRARPTFEKSVGSLPVSIAVAPPATKQADDEVMNVTAELPLANLTILPRDDGYVGRVHVYLSVFDENGRNIGFQHQLQEVTLPAATGGEPTGHFKYTMKVHVRPGAAVTFVMTLRDELSNDMGSALQATKL